jgi:hypothetical protein
MIYPAKAREKARNRGSRSPLALKTVCATAKVKSISQMTSKKK